MAEILASIEDINAHLPAEGVSPVAIADDVNTASIQISVARVVRGYLAGVIDRSTLATWTSPGSTPEIIREAASLLIASQHYMNAVSGQTIDIDQRNYSQVLYDRAIAILNGVISGDIGIDPPIGVTPTGVLTVDDFFPVDDTDRAFTLGMQL